MPNLTVRFDEKRIEGIFHSEGLPTLVHATTIRRDVFPRAQTFLLAISGIFSVGATLMLSSASGPHASRGTSWTGAGTAISFVVIGIYGAAIWLRRSGPAWLNARTPEIGFVLLIGHVPATLTLTMVKNVPRLGTGHMTAAQTAETLAYFLGFWLLLILVACVITMLGVPRLLNLVRADFFEFGTKSMDWQTRTLPALVILLLFFFLNPDVWQVADGLGTGRITLLVLLLLVVAGLSGAARIRDVAATLAKQVREDPGSVPWPATTCDGKTVTAQDRRVPHLTFVQKINVTLALTARQLTQAVWVGAGVFVFLYVLGMITVPAQTADKWLGHRQDNARIFILVPVVMAKVAVLLATFSVLYFVVMTTAEKQYRAEFHDPLAERLRRLLRLHAAYCAYVGQPTSEPLQKVLVLVLVAPLALISAAVSRRTPPERPVRWNPDADPLLNPVRSAEPSQSRPASASQATASAADAIPP